MPRLFFFLAFLMALSGDWSFGGEFLPNVCVGVVNPLAFDPRPLWGKAKDYFNSWVTKNKHAGTLKSNGLWPLGPFRSGYIGKGPRSNDEAWLAFFTLWNGIPPDMAQTPCHAALLAAHRLELALGDL